MGCQLPSQRKKQLERSGPKTLPGRNGDLAYLVDHPSILFLRFVLLGSLVSISVFKASPRFISSATEYRLDQPSCYARYPSSCIAWATYGEYRYSDLIRSPRYQNDSSYDIHFTHAYVNSPIKKVISTRGTRFINFPSVISPCYPTQWSISATSALLPQHMQSTISLAACSFHQTFLKYPRPSLNSRAFVGNILQIKCKCAFLDIALILNEMNIHGLDGLEFFHFLYMIKWWSWFYKVFGKVCLLLLYISFSNFRAVCAKFHILFFSTYPLQIQ